MRIEAGKAPDPLPVSSREQREGGATATGDPDAVDLLCREYGYPTEVEGVLREITALLGALEPVSVLLHGSTARGELSWWADGDGQLQLASDIEMYAVYETMPAGEALAGTDAALQRLADAVGSGKSDLFHVDVGHISLAELRRHPATFRCWDTRATGRTLLGADVRDELPDVGLGDMDYRQLNEVPIHRLWEMAFRFPASMLRGEASRDDEARFAYVCGRQTLDLTTWLLPHFGILIPTFRARVAEWQRQFAKLPLARYFPPASGSFLEECLHGKLSYSFARPARELHREVLDYFRAGLRLLLGIDPAADDAETASGILEQGEQHWNSETTRRRVYEAYVVMRDGQFLRPRAAMRWWSRRKKPLQVAVLLYMNAALADLLAGEDATGNLERAEFFLSDLWYGFTPRSRTQQERFLDLRRGYVDYLTRTNRWFARRREYLYSVIDLVHEA